MITRRHLLASAVVMLSSGVRAADRLPLVAAASSLKGLLDEFAVEWERDTGTKIRVVFGATSNLLRQVEQGAPFELFLAADEESVQRLAAVGLTVTPPRVFARGRLSLVVPVSSQLPLDGGLAGLDRAIKSGVIGRFAIANPELAPYGRAAQQALQAAGLWDTLQPRLLLAENIALAATLVASGGAQAGLTAASVLELPGLARTVRSAPIAQDQHAPIRHAAVGLKGASPTALAVLARFTAPAQQARLATHGFAAP